MKKASRVLAFLFITFLTLSSFVAKAPAKANPTTPPTVSVVAIQGNPPYDDFNFWVHYPSGTVLTNAVYVDITVTYIDDCTHGTRAMLHHRVVIPAGQYQAFDNVASCDHLKIVATRIDAWGFM